MEHSHTTHATDQEGLEFEMPGKSEIMRAVRDGLNNLEVDISERDTVWTKTIKTKLCEIGQDRFGCKVGARDVDKAARDYGEWLYDVTWLEYERYGLLIDAHLVAECEWSDFEAIVEDFEKLLLARAGVRLMIFDGNYEPGSKEIAERLAGGSGSSTAPAPRMLGCWRPGKGVMTAGCSSISRLR